MLKYTVLFLALVSSAKEGWGRERFTIETHDGNHIGAVLKSAPFIKIDDGYYFFGRESVNWYVAYEKCRELEAELVTFETDEEFDAIARYLKANADRGNYWSSGNDLGKTGIHKWFSNGQRINSLRWAHGQPDNAGDKEHCIHLGYIYKDSQGFELNDRPCAYDGNSLFRFICEAPKLETISIVVWK
ncbi:GL21206 [Drosophila persimilis]|uniref:C-type lectin 37Da-like n=2 Tax=pseudoobscura subgroup TaxID=32358 RepID=Q29K46_DROPS|nr:C-type lectin 37Da [Drosophila pseudoobscura]XP_002023160.1 C-type lectin 37Da [Drosophila persimilis]EDW27288.1 GL21206 [Drosophila persimilis]